jgi:hypothetical protein
MAGGGDAPSISHGACAAVLFNMTCAQLIGKINIAAPTSLLA